MQYIEEYDLKTNRGLSEKKSEIIQAVNFVMVSLALSFPLNCSIVKPDLYIFKY